MEVFSGRRLLDPFGQGTRNGIEVLADKFSRPCVHDSVPADCIEKVVSEKGENTLHQRLSTPRPTPRILNSVWNTQQQQDFLVGTGTLVVEQNLGNRSSYSKRSTGTPVAEEENSFQADLGIQGVPQDAVLEDKECPKFKDWLTSCELDNRSLTI